MRHNGAFTVHSGIVPTLLAFNPYGTPPSLPRNGIPLGFFENGEVFSLNLAEWADKEIINTPSLVLFGMQGSGKTTLAKMIARSLGTLKRKPNDPDSPFRTVWADDSKAHEYEALTRYFGCEPLRIQNRRINPLSEEMELKDQSFMCARIIGQADGQPVLPHHMNVIDAGLEKIRTDKRPPSLQELAVVLNDSESLPPPRLHEDTEVRVDMPHDLFQAHCLDMTVRISNMLRGEYGQVFGHGTDQTVTEMLKQRIVNVDYSGANEEIVRIIQMLFWLWKKTNMFDVNIYDESYGLLRHIEFARPLHDAIKRNREARRTIVLITHGMRDYVSLGGDAGKLAVSLFKEAPVWITGQLEESDVEDLRELRRFSTKVRDMILHLKPTEFVAFIGNKTEPFKFTSFVPARMLDITFSNQALAAELGRKTR